MIWVGIAVVAALALAPFFWCVWHGARLRGRQDAAVALHQAQLLELDRDLEQGRILPPEHAAAQLEVQRRLLADAALSEAMPARSGTIAVAVVALLVPLVAIVLYGRLGVPDYREAASRAADAKAVSPEELAKDRALIEKLKGVLATLEPNSDRTRQGYVMLGNADLSVDDLPAAADAFRKALAVRFDATLGAETAEIISEVSNKVTPEAAALFRRALQEAPADAKWRKAAEQRLSEAGAS